MPEFYLMRHGHYEGHAEGHHAPPLARLSAIGKRQVECALPLPHTIERIVTSPLPRAWDTARLLSGASGIPVIASSVLLTEWRAPSDVIGRTPATYPSAYRAWRRHRTDRPELAYGDGESLLELHARASLCARLLHELARPSGDLLVVSHKIFLGALVRLDQGPRAFDAAARACWPFTAVRRVPALLPGTSPDAGGASSIPPKAIRSQLPS